MLTRSRRNQLNVKPNELESRVMLAGDSVSDNSFFRLSPEHSDKFLAVRAGAHDAGENVILYSGISSSEDQVWYFDQVGGEEHWFQIKNFSGNLSGSTSDLYLTAGAGPRSNVSIESRDASNHQQQWGFIGDSDGTYEIVNRAHYTTDPSVLDVSAWGKTNGSNVQIWNRTGGANQAWALDKVEMSELP